MQSTSSSPLVSLSLEFDDSVVSCPAPVVSDDDMFGIVTIQSLAPPYVASSTPILIVFSIDCSASMSDMCGDGRTKMHHALFTMENIVKKLHGYGEPRITIQVQAFDNDIVEIISASKSLCQMNLDEVVAKIRAIESRGATDIGLALQSAHRTIKAFGETHPERVQMVHMMLTDGEITQGITDVPELLGLVNSNCSMICVGYGAEHDSALMSRLCARRGDEYRFIDSIERVGFVYGELLCRIMNKVVESPVLICTNCMAFDFKHNQWTDQLKFGDVLIDQTRTFHVRRSKSLMQEQEHSTAVQITGLIPHTINSITVSQKPSADKVDLAKYQYRQRTQELLYNANLFIKKLVARRDSYFDQPMHYQQDHTKEKDHVIQQLTEFLACLSAHMTGAELTADPFWKMLQTDIRISVRCLGDDFMNANHANMYVEARQASQGNQFSYMCSQPPDNCMSFDVRRMPASSMHYGRQHSDDNSFRMTANVATPDQFSVPQDEDADNVVPESSAFQEQETSEDFISPYASETTTRMMRDISCNRQP